MTQPVSGALVTIRSYSPREKVHTSKPVPIAVPFDHKEQKIQRVFSGVLHAPTPSQKVDSPRPLTPSPVQRREIAEFLPPVSPEVMRENMLLEKILSPPRSNVGLSCTQIHANRTPEEREVFQKFMDTFRYVQSFSENVLTRYC